MFANLCVYFSVSSHIDVLIYLLLNLFIYFAVCLLQPFWTRVVLAALAAAAATFLLLAAAWWGVEAAAGRRLAVAAAAVAAAAVVFRCVSWCCSCC